MRYRLNTKEIIAILLGISVYIGVSLCFEIFMPKTLHQIILPVQIIWLTILAALFGPITGVLVSFVGSCVADGLLYGSVNWVDMIPITAMGFGIGKYAYKYGVFDGIFGKKNSFEFNCVQIMVNIFSWAFFYPLSDFFVNHVNLLDGVENGMKIVFWNVSATLIVCTPILLLISERVRKKDRQSMPYKETIKPDDEPETDEASEK